MRKQIYHIAILVVAFVISMHTLNAQNDTLTMSTGETIVGEIKELKTGVIYIETDYSNSDFNIEWDKVVYIKSERIFLINITDGNRYNGSLISLPGQSKVNINDLHKGQLTVEILDIFYLKAVDQSFLSRLDLLMSVGYTLTKANDNHQFSGRLNVGYLSNTFGTTLSFGIVRSVQTADNITTNTRRTEGGLDFRFFFIRDWFAIVAADLLQSSEQKLELRSLTKAGIGNFLIKSNQKYFMLVGGAAWNFENFSDPTVADRNSLEAFAGVEYNIFDIGDLDLRTSLFGYPSLTESGRFRSDFNFDLKYEFPLDFFINLGFTLNYDNQPIEGATTTDYVLQTTFGWEL